MSRHIWQVMLVALVTVLCGCNSSGGGGSGSDNRSPGFPAVNLPTPSAANALQIIVDGGPSVLKGTYINAPFTSVTVCVPGSSNCQTIDHVLVDTGSFGLRLIASQTHLALPTVAAPGGGVGAECLMFGDGSTSFGPLVSADVHIGGEVAQGLTVHLIGGPVGTRPANCPGGSQAADDVTTLGANGILGIGVLRYDCGIQCTFPVNNGNPGTYYACVSGFCNAAAFPLASQVQNPVIFFPVDNNGIVVDLPVLPNHASVFVSGTVFFGVGTQSNNPLNATNALTTSADSAGNAGEIKTQFPAGSGSANIDALVDTGSNAFFFNPPRTINLPMCGDNQAFFCPGTTQSYTGVMSGLNGVTNTVNFQIANADQGFSTMNEAFDDIGGDILDADIFDWGLPFFYGRSVYIVIDGQTSPAGPGPFFAF